MNPSVNTANNRLSTSDNYAFDSSGNTTGDAEGRTFVYDAENKQISVSDSNGTIGEYFYDGDGKRIKKIVPSTGETTIFAYDAAGKLIGEYSTILQTGSNANTVYTTNDHLGSPRINTDATGQVISRHDYHPFGEEIARTGYGSDTIRKQFTGYELDEESGLEYARLRMYSNRLGRFTAADPILPDIYSPATQNRYQYCLNNPLRFIDSGGGYDEEVHRDFTAAMAYVAGFSIGQGNTIGKADQWLDEDASGLSAVGGGRKAYDNRILWHFTNLERRNDLWNEVEFQVDNGYDPLSALGTFLHAEQDSFSHERQGFGPVAGQGAALGEGFDIKHPIDSTYDGMAKYDKTNWSPQAVELAVEMARDTLGKLLQARNRLAASGRFGSFRRPVPFSAIESKVREWAVTEGRDNKRVILNQILYIVCHYFDPPQDAGARKKKKKTKTSVKIGDED